MFSTETGLEDSHAIVPVTPPEIGAQAVDTAERIAKSRVVPEDWAQLLRPWYSMHTFTVNWAEFIVVQKIAA